MELLKIIESPDHSLKNDIYEQRDAVAFSYIKNNLALLFYDKLIYKNLTIGIKEIKEELNKQRMAFLRTHGMIKYLVNVFFYNKHSFALQSSLDGRLWTRSKVVSFWYKPSKNEYLKFYKDLKASGIKLDMTWRIELNNEKLITPKLYYIFL